MSPNDCYSHEIQARHAAMCPRNSDCKDHLVLVSHLQSSVIFEGEDLKREHECSASYTSKTAARCSNLFYPYQNPNVENIMMKMTVLGL